MLCIPVALIISAVKLYHGMLSACYQNNWLHSAKSNDKYPISVSSQMLLFPGGDGITAKYRVYTIGAGDKEPWLRTFFSALRKDSQTSQTVSYSSDIQWQGE